MKKYHFVYKTTCLVTGMYYIGSHSTNNLNDTYLGSGTILLNAISKYGRKQFKREILEQFPTREDAYMSERDYIAKLGSVYPGGYNLSPTGGPGLLGQHSDETKKKISEKNKGFIPTEEHKRKVAEGNKGKIVSKETRRKIGEARKGVKHTAESRKKMAESGRKKVFTAEHRRNIAEANKKIARTKEWNEKVRQSRLGQKLPPVECPHCGTVMDPGNAKRYHFDNCKRKAA